MIILSGMNLTIAMHLCGGEISQIKVSITHQKAGCGMCGEEETTSPEKTISNESCCKDQMAFYAVDTNYSSSTLQIKHTVNQLLQVFDIPKMIGIVSIHTNSIQNTNVQPPDNYIASAVSLPDICVFRI